MYAIALSAVIGAVVLKVVFKVWGPSPLNIYDEKDVIASIPNHCLFCRLIRDNKEVVYEDDLVYVFHDLYPKAQTHLLVIPKRHIKNLYHLKPSDLELIEHMKSTANDIKTKINPAADAKIGFHHPLFNSVLHLHLHILILPYTHEFFGKMRYNRHSFVDIDDCILALRN